PRPRAAHGLRTSAPPAWRLNFTTRTTMPLQFERSWRNEELDALRDTAVRFIETEMQPQDEAARKRGHVGHALWRRAGELGLLCTDIPEAYGGGGGDFRHEAVIHEEMARRGLTGMSNSV